jgi:hypothetical protein|tara:strand:+ start:1654 stop:3273 length:1620 start_codon:yes stop_codon:yes gene_type:complete
MVDINKLVNKYSAPKIDNLQALFEVISHVAEVDLIEREMLPKKTTDEETDTLTLSYLPEIGVSELGWASLQTGDGEAVPSEQRAQLARFLDNIAQGADLQDKLTRLANFYELSENTLDDLKSGSESEKIRKTIGYLTFYKTLTKIITNFNASAAGFAFESFLGVLLGGNQIATGNKTIADLTAGDGTPISLKLYAEKSVSVDGSYTDLVNDLIREPNLMQYVVVMKDLQGKGLELEGTLKFYRFNFTLNNVYDILSMSKHPEVLQLPKQFVRDPEGFDVTLPDYMSIEDAEKMFADTVYGALEDDMMAEKVLQALDWANNASLFTKATGSKRSRFKVGKYNPNKFPVNSPLGQTLIGLQQSGDIEADASMLLKLYNVLFQANELILKQFLDTERARNQKIASLKTGFAAVSTSRRVFNNLDEETKRKALLVSRGYLYTDQFGMNRSQVLNVPENSLPAGQENIKIGEIEIGVSKIQVMLNNVRDIINGAIFEIFNSLKILTTNLQAYFAGGLENDSMANNAIAASADIGQKTEKIKSGD